MKKIINYALLPIVACTMAMAFTACSNDKDDNKDNSGFDLVITNPIVDNDNYPSNTVAANYSKKNFGEDAIDGCAKVVDQLSKANNAIQRTNLTEQQESYLREVLKNLVSNVIIPTYTELANDVETLEKTLNGLTVRQFMKKHIPGKLFSRRMRLQFSL